MTTIPIPLQVFAKRAGEELVNRLFLNFRGNRE